MKTRVFTGSKQQIVEGVASLSGSVREAIIFIDDSANVPANGASAPADIFQEMSPYVVRAGRVDYSRRAIYEQAEGE